MNERAEVDYRETQYGLRNKDGGVRPLNIGPDLAQRGFEAGLDIVKRQKTVYMPDVTDWCAPFPTPTQAHATTEPDGDADE